MDTLSIGELAKHANVNVETIRYYEPAVKKRHVCSGSRDGVGGLVLFYADSGDFAWRSWIERIYALSGFRAVTGFMSRFTFLEPLRPYLLGAAILLLGFSFWKLSMIERKSIQ